MIDGVPWAGAADKALDQGITREIKEQTAQGSSDVALQQRPGRQAAQVVEGGAVPHQCGSRGVVGPVAQGDDGQSGLVAAAGALQEAMQFVPASAGEDVRFQGGDAGLVSIPVQCGSRPCRCQLSADSMSAERRCRPRNSHASPAVSEGSGRR